MDFDNNDEDVCEAFVAQMIIEYERLRYTVEASLDAALEAWPPSGPVLLAETQPLSRERLVGFMVFAQGMALQAEYVGKFDEQGTERAVRLSLHHQMERFRTIYDQVLAAKLPDKED